MSAILNITGVTKNLGHKKVLDGVSLNVEEGKFLGIIGPNGAGKTTLLKIMTKLLEPSSGSVSYSGLRSRETSSYLDRIGSVIENPEYFDFLTCRDILNLKGRIKGITGHNLKEEIERVSSLCGISGYIDRKTGALSTGMRQKLAIAAAFMGDPQVLILDEPLSGIDIYSAKEILTILSDAKKRGKTTAVITFHEMGEMLELVDDVAFMVDGRIVNVAHTDRDHDFYCVESSEELEPDSGLKLFSSMTRSDGTRLTILQSERDSHPQDIVSRVIPHSDVKGIWKCSPVALQYEEFLRDYYSAVDKPA